MLSLHAICIHTSYLSFFYTENFTLKSAKSCDKNCLKTKQCKFVTQFATQQKIVNTLCKNTLCVKLYIACKITHCVNLHTMCKITH